MMNLVYKKEYSGIAGFLNNVFESDVVEREQKGCSCRKAGHRYGLCEGKY